MRWRRICAAMGALALGLGIATGPGATQVAPVERPRATPDPRPAQTPPRQRVPRSPRSNTTWKDVNLAAAVPGWKRFRPLADRRERARHERPKATPSAAGVAASASNPSGEAVRRQVSRAALGDPAEQDRLFREFLEWRRRQQQ